MFKFSTLSALTLLPLTFASPLLAQDDTDGPVPFAGGELTITENADMEKILAFNGKELLRNYMLFYDGTVEVQDMPVALFQAGEGGNACGPQTVIVWKPEGGEVQSVLAGDDCGSPPPAVTDDSIYFVPYLLPGTTSDVQVWSPDEGLRVAGSMRFVPQPDTGWTDLEPESIDHIIDAFDNGGIYTAATGLLGDDMDDVVSSLVVGSEPERLPSGVFYATGCVPHACGVSDGFMAVDPKAQKLYFAQQTDAEPKTWPDLSGWPANIRDAMEKGLVKK